MKKTLAALMILVLCLGMTGTLAEMSYEGTIVAAETLPVKADFGASVEKVYVREGDLIQAGDPIVQLKSNPVFAPCDGTVTAVFAEEGDTLDDTKTRYGGTVYIEPTRKYVISATTEKAYGASETKMVHIGETVYLSCAQDGSHTGPAQVTAIGENDDYGNTTYTLEVLGGEFYIGETVDIFRSSSLSATTRLGRGTVKQQKPVVVEGSGSLLKLHVHSGDTVQRGQLLFETVEGVLDGLYAGSLLVQSPVNGIVAKVEAEKGGSVAKDADIITLYPTEQLQAQVNVPVTDLSAFVKGQKAVVELDIGSDELLRYDGQVESVSYLVTGEGRNMAVKAHVSFAADNQVRAGMPVVVYPVRMEETENVTEEAPAETASDETKETSEQE